MPNTARPHLCRGAATVTSIALSVRHPTVSSSRAEQESAYPVRCCSGSSAVPSCRRHPATNVPGFAQRENRPRRPQALDPLDSPALDAPLGSQITGPGRTSVAAAVDDRRICTTRPWSALIQWPALPFWTRPGFKLRIVQHDRPGIAPLPRHLADRQLPARLCRSTLAGFWI